MKRKLITFSIVMGATIAVAAIFIHSVYQDSNNSQTVSESESAELTLNVNENSGFYNSDIQIEATVPYSDTSVIYYTTDCSEPSETSSTSSLYTAPITLEAGEDEVVHTLKFKVYNGDESSDTYTYTYVMGQNVSERYDTMVVSISGDEDDLFGYENGVFVAGKLRQDYLDANPDISENDLIATDPANYNVHGMESERPVTVQIFSSDGMSILTQDCGLRIFGNYSRAKAQKSFQLFARTSYSGSGNFNITLSPSTTTKDDGTILDKANRLLFRNSGDDFNHGFIRDTLLQNLASQAGYLFAYTDHPAAVYLDNEYYGFYWVREPFNDGYMQNMYGDYNGEFVTLEVNDYTRSVVTDDDAEKQEELEPYSEEFQNVYDTYSEADLNDDATYEALNSIIDVDNYLQYFAIEMYIGNKDWPYNNMKVYRYSATDGNYTSDSIFDGRYRYLLFDTDYSFGLISNYTAYNYDDDNIGLIAGNDQSLLFSNLMTREDCRETEINYLCDLINGSFSYDNVKSTLDSLDAERLNELTHFLDDSDLPDDDVTIDSVEDQVDNILTYAKERPTYILQFIQSDFPVSGEYTVDVASPDTAQVNVNSIEDVGSSFTGTYFASCGLTLSANVEDGHSFCYWLINGERFTDETLTLDEDDLESLINNNDKLQVQLVVEDKTDATPIVYMLQTQGKDDKIILYNPSGHTITTDGYYLSDDADHLKEYEIPSLSLSSDDSVTLYGEKNEETNAVGQYRMTFNLSAGETLYLSDQDGNILEQITIPDMSEDTSWYVRNLMTGAYTEQELTSLTDTSSTEDETDESIDPGNMDETK